MGRISEDIVAGVSPRSRSRTSSRGAALLEFAVVIPLIILVSVWVGTLGFAIAQLVWLSESSYAAALAGAEDRSSTVSTAEGAFLRLHNDRHGSSSVVVLNGDPHGAVIETNSTQSPLVTLGVSIGSRPLGGLPSLSLGLTTVVARLTPGGDPGDLSEPANISGACNDGWSLECGTCGSTGCSANGNGNSGDKPSIMSRGSAPNSLASGDDFVAFNPAGQEQEVGESFNPDDYYIPGTLQ